MSAQPKVKSAKSKEAAQTAPDERDAVIARLERELAEERQNSAALRASIEELRFKLEIGEKSYLKQLSDARVRRDAAEQQLAEKQERVLALDATIGETLQLLKTTHEQLERLAADHDRLCKALARRDGLIVKTTSRTYSADSAEHGPSIDEMLAAPAVGRDRRDGHLSARVAAPAEQPHAEMLSAELVFTKSDEDDEK